MSPQHTHTQLHLCLCCTVETIWPWWRPDGWNRFEFSSLTPLHKIWPPLLLSTQHYAYKSYSCNIIWYVKHTFVHSGVTQVPGVMRSRLQIISAANVFTIVVAGILYLHSLPCSTCSKLTPWICLDSAIKLHRWTSCSLKASVLTEMTKADSTCLERVAEMLYVFSARDPISEWVAVILHGEWTNLPLPHEKEAVEANVEVNRLGSSSVTYPPAHVPQAHISPPSCL